MVLALDSLHDSMSLSPVSTIRPQQIDLETIPPLGLGGATFSTQFNPHPDDEASLPVQAILRRALSLGINLIDTSPYYGNSEIVLGRALRAVWTDGWTREGMFICTKVGRIEIDKFDYSRGAVRRSVERSLSRLGVQVLDVVYCHDVEFVTKNEVLEALEVLFSFKDAGKIRYVGISGILSREINVGLPVDLLVELSQLVKSRMNRTLDVVLSYSHMTLQNSTLPAAVPKFYAAGVRKVITASPLSMGLLRSAGPQAWHPATATLRQSVARASKFVESQGHSFAETSMRYVVAKWDGCIIGGWSSVKELEAGVKMWHRVRSGISRAEDEKLWKGARDIMGDQVDTMWSSPQKGWTFTDGTKVE
jgi:D-arabinose 1-dehydrogenase